MKKYRLIIFDMDGTVLDTAADLCASLNFALESCGYPRRTPEQVRAFLGNGMRKLIERGAPSGTPEQELDRVQHIFSDHYKEHCYDKTRPYDGIESLIISLRKAGYITAVVSNKDDYAVKILCEKYFPGLFDMAVGARDGLAKKPAPDLVNEVLNRFQTGRSDALYIGDSEVDILTAQNSGMDCITVLWGFRTPEFLLDCGAGIMTASPSDILKLLSDN